MRTCEMCGAELAPGNGICPSCGFAYSSEGLSPDTRMSAAQWGKILVDLNEVAAADDAFVALEKAWREREKYTVLGFFPGQFDRIPELRRRFAIYGPEDAFISIRESLRALAGSALTFIPITDAELELLRDNFANG